VNVAAAEIATQREQFVCRVLRNQFVCDQFCEQLLERELGFGLLPGLVGFVQAGSRRHAVSMGVDVGCQGVMSALLTGYRGCVAL